MTKYRTILFVDDDIYATRPIVDFIERRGFNVLTARTLTEAKDLFQGNEIDLAIIDAKFPYGNSNEDVIVARGGFNFGMTLGAWIKRNHLLVPFFDLTVVSDLEVVTWFREHSAGIILKPVVPPQAMYLRWSIRPYAKLATRLGLVPLLCMVMMSQQSTPARISFRMFFDSQNPLFCMSDLPVGAR